MKLASIREFRSRLCGYGKEGDMILVTNHGKMVGCFLPFDKVKDVPIEFKKEFIARLGRKIAGSLTSRKISEEEVLDDFKKFKKNSRG